MTRTMEPKRLAHDEIETPLGRLVLVANELGELCLVGWIKDHRRTERTLGAFGAGAYSLERRENPGGVSRALRAYFAGDLSAIDDLQVSPAGTEFQRRVWRELRTIPCGETLSYGELARRIGNPAAVRAVGLANGANPVGIVVPCHRVIGADGTLTGYGGGIERKRWLLAHERARGVLELPWSEAERAPQPSV